MRPWIRSLRNIQPKGPCGSTKCPVQNTCIEYMDRTHGQNTWIEYKDRLHAQNIKTCIEYMYRIHAQDTCIKYHKIDAQTTYTAYIHGAHTYTTFIKYKKCYILYLSRFWDMVYEVSRFEKAFQHSPKPSTHQVQRVFKVLSSEK